MKPTKKQLSQQVNVLTDKNGEALGHPEILNFFAEYKEPEKALALAIQLGLTLEEALTIENDYDNSYSVNGEEYNVMTDEEADEAWDEDLENYIDECILPEVDERYKMYFDNEKWKRDARIDGRGHSLNHYDGSEEEQKINETWYYIYRTN